MFDCGRIKNGKEHPHLVTRADFYLTLGILVCALLLFVFFQLPRAPGAYAEISYDGVVLKKISLSESEEKYYLIEEAPILGKETIVQRESAMVQEKTASADEEAQIAVYELTKEEWMAWQEAVSEAEEIGGYNIFVCHNKEVRMIRSNCPDKICVQHNAISAAGENIVCLPHKVVIEIVDEENTELDGIVG